MIANVRRFLPGVALDCDSPASGNVGPDECSGTLNPGWFQIGFDKDGQLLKVRFDGIATHDHRRRRSHRLGKRHYRQALAAHFGLPHLDTGLLYRAVGRQVFLDGGDPDHAGDALAATAFPDGLLTDPELRSEATGGLASRVSVHAPVRQALYQRQRSFATQPGGAVLDGRDIGTVIAPDAEVKLFVVASIEARALRRWKEMQRRGTPHTRAEIEADLRRRDERDRTRADAAPRRRRCAGPRHLRLGPDEAIAAAIALVAERLEERR